MKIVKSANFGVPPIVIGPHLDQVLLKQQRNLDSSEQTNTDQQTNIGSHLDQVLLKHKEMK